MPVNFTVAGSSAYLINALTRHIELTGLLSADEAINAIFGLGYCHLSSFTRNGRKGLVTEIRRLVKTYKRDNPRSGLEVIIEDFDIRIEEISLQRYLYWRYILCRYLKCKEEHVAEALISLIMHAGLQVCASCIIEAEGFHGLIELLLALRNRERQNPSQPLGYYAKLY